RAGRPLRFRAGRPARPYPHENGEHGDAMSEQAKRIDLYRSGWQSIRWTVGSAWFRAVVAVVAAGGLGVAAWLNWPVIESAYARTVAGWTATPEPTPLAVPDIDGVLADARASA